MSQRKLTLPVVLEHTEQPVDLRPDSIRAYVENPKAARFNSVFVKRPAQGRHLDPWDLRDEFLRCAVNDWRGFIEMAGWFGEFRISESDFAEWQTLIRAALVTPANEWKRLEAKFDPRKVAKLFRPLPITFNWDGAAPTAVIRTGKTLQAIIATVQLGHLQGSKFRTCARPDCTAPPFELRSHRDRIYCSEDCGHLMAVRNQRARLRSKVASKSKSR